MVNMTYSTSLSKCIDKHQCAPNQDFILNTFMNVRLAWENNLKLNWVEFWCSGILKFKTSAALFPLTSIFIERVLLWFIGHIPFSHQITIRIRWLDRFTQLNFFTSHIPVIFFWHTLHYLIVTPHLFLR